MILAHISDLHFYRFPHWTGIPTKRLIGLANLYIRGRIRHFDAGIARQAILQVIADRPDGVVITGDLTALGSPGEFEMARQELEPLLERLPTVIVPGNHDFYTRGAVRNNRICQYFGDEIRTPGSSDDDPVFPTLHIIGDAAVIGLNPNRFSWAAAGRLEADELQRLGEILRSPEVHGRFTVLAMHYPLLNEGGTITCKFWRRLAHPQRLIQVLAKNRVDLLLHGHDHRRYNNFAPASAPGLPPTLMANSGSAGYSRGSHPATYNLYRIENGHLAEVIFRDWRAGRFQTSFQGPPEKIPRQSTPLR